MSVLIRPFFAVLALAFTAAFFGPAHRFLPPKTRVSSMGFVSVVLAFFGAAVLRHSFVAETSHIAQALVATTVWFLVLVALFASSRGPGCLTLVLAVSSGVDLSAALFGIVGVDIAGGATPALLLGWEVLAMVVASTRMGMHARASNS